MGLTTISTKSKLLIALGLFLFLAGLISAIVCGILVVNPALRFLGFDKATCSVQSLSFQGNKTCDEVLFPCAKIMVNTTDDNTVRMVYYNDKALEGRNTFGCTFVTCGKTYQENAKEVTRLSAIYGDRNNLFDCLFNPDDHEQIIIKPKFGQMDVIHSLVWPVLALLVGLVLLVFMIHKEKKKIMLMCIKAQA